MSAIVANQDAIITGRMIAGMGWDFLLYIQSIHINSMLSRKKGDDIGETLQGPVGILAIAIIIVGGVFAVAAEMDKTTPKAPDKSILFGGFLKDLIVEGKFYAYSLAPLIIIIGGIMTGGLLVVVIPKQRQGQPSVG